MMELPNHLVPWDTVKKLLKEAWQEGYDAGGTDASNFEDLRDGYAYYDDYEDTPNPYQEDA